MNEYSGVITRFIEDAQQKQPLVIYGDGSQTRDFVNVHDAVSAVIAAAEKPEAEGQIFNVGSGTSTSINDLAKTVLDLVKADVPVTHEVARTGDIKASYADISKTRNLLGYSPKVSLADGLKSLLSEKPSLV